MRAKRGEVAERLPARGGAASGGMALMFTVYVIKSLHSGRLYVGYTENIDNRIKEHNRGKVRSTKAYIPYYLVYKEESLLSG